MIYNLPRYRKKFTWDIYNADMDPDGNWVKGTISYGTITSEKENKYPENGFYQGYWYVKR